METRGAAEDSTNGSAYQREAGPSSEISAPIQPELVILANRLPVRKVRSPEGARWETSPGGLVAALRPVLEGMNGKWVGWSGVRGKTDEPFGSDGIRHFPVTMSGKEVRAHYEGYCNRTIWPLYHDAVRPSRFDRDWWKTHVEINQRFADAAAACASPNASVWVHDYHLQLVPRMLREKRPDLRLGFFLHIPFPPPELFERLPERREIVQGLLGADVIGFQTARCATNFAQCAESMVGAWSEGETLRLDGRAVVCRAFPISIDAEKCARIAAQPRNRARAKSTRHLVGKGRRILLGVDRLDYTKGIDARLRAYRELLRTERLRAEDHVLVQIAVPSRELVKEYSDQRETVERIVGEINGEFGEIGHPAVYYIHRNQPFDKIVAFYSAADVMLVTPFRDGMNLVAKEYVAARTASDGVLVLSQFAGAAVELTEAVQVNPFDQESLMRGMLTALEMPHEEAEWRMSAMRTTVFENDVFTWAESFLASMKTAGTPAVPHVPRLGGASLLSER